MLSFACTTNETMNKIPNLFKDCKRAKSDEGKKAAANLAGCQIDFGLIQNTDQIEFLFSLETKRINPICLWDRTWYDMYRTHLGV